MFDLFSLMQWEKMIDDAAAPYKKFCTTHGTVLPENWRMIFHTSFKHDVPASCAGRVLFSEYMVDLEGKPAIVVMDLNYNKPILTLGLRDRPHMNFGPKEHIMASS